jgi:hypothetical protein
MAQQRRPRRQDPRTDAVPPVLVWASGFDLAHDVVDHRVEELVLVGHVLVERHGDDVEALGQVAHAQRLDADLVGEGHRGLDDVVALKPGALAA